MRFELTTPTLARLCSTPELRPRSACGASTRRPAGTIIGTVNGNASARGGAKAGRADLFAFFDALGIVVETAAHPPVFTVAEARALRGRIPSGHCKCLFLKDKKGGLWLVVADESRRVDLTALSRRLGAPRFSFGKPDLLREALGVEPGSVTPFALINDRAARRVRPVLDAEMLARDRLNFHPLENTATTTIAPADLRAFVAACGHTPYIVNFSGLGAGGESDASGDRR